MSLDYTLSIAGLAPSEDLRQRLGNAEELSVWFVPLTPERIELIEQSFCFTPTTCILFELDKFKDYLATKIALLRACVVALQAGTGDAALVFNGEEVILRRINGRVLLNSIENSWPDDVLRVLPWPCELTAMTMD